MAVEDNKVCCGAILVGCSRFLDEQIARLKTALAKFQSLMSQASAFKSRARWLANGPNIAYRGIAGKRSLIYRDRRSRPWSARARFWLDRAGRWAILKPDWRLEPMKPNDKKNNEWIYSIPITRVSVRLNQSDSYSIYVAWQITSNSILNLFHVTYIKYF